MSEKSLCETVDDALRDLRERNVDLHERLVEANRNREALKMSLTRAQADATRLRVALKATMDALSIYAPAVERAPFGVLHDARTQAYAALSAPDTLLVAVRELVAHCTIHVGTSDGTREECGAMHCTGACPRDRVIALVGR